jgi:hypothetical protein
MRAHEERPEQSGRRAVEPRQTQARHGDSPAQDAVLRLQHSVGNQVVARALDPRRDAAEDEPSTVPDVLRSAGTPLDTATRTEFEARFGTDFADVRVHTGAAAQRSAAEIGARAYTSGNHVVIGEHGDDPQTMAHELTHVIQQRQGPVRGAPAGNGLRVSDPDDEFERAAEATATEVLRAPAAGHDQGLRRSIAHQTEPSSVVYRAPKAPKPDPVLTATLVSGDNEEGLCGNFVRARTWNVANPVKGVIIQKVTRVFNVEAFQHGSWAPISGANLDAYVTDPGSSVHAATTEYWELWPIGPKGGFGPDGKKDTFGLASLIPDATTVADTTKGTYRISGEASFYPTDKEPADLGFARGAVQAAGGLFSRTTNPASDLTANGVTAVGSAVTYTVNVSWNSTTSTDIDDGHPKLAWSDVR